MRGRFVCALHHESRTPPPAEGWSIGVRAIGATITSIGVEGTDAEYALEHGFARNELTQGIFNEGAISQVTYSFVEPRALSLAEPRTIAAIEVEARPTRTPTEIGLYYLHGFRTPTGIVDTFVDLEGQRHFPARHSKTVLAVDGPACGDVMLGFSAVNVDDPTPFQGLLGGPRAAGFLDVPTEVGTTGSVRAFANLTSLPSVDGGVQQWKFCVVLDGSAEFASVTTHGTAIDRYPGFEHTVLLDPEEFGGRQAVATSVALGWQFFHVLPDVGTFTVLSMEVKQGEPQGHDDQVSTLRFAECASPSTGRVPIQYLRNSGGIRSFCNAPSAFLSVRFREKLPMFRRGDSNGDGRLDVGDSVWTLQELFGRGSPGPCADASDTNDDGRIDISDASMTIRYCFLGAPPPPAPFPSCGVDPDGDKDGLPCTDDPASCEVVSNPAT